MKANKIISIFFLALFLGLFLISCGPKKELSGIAAVKQYQKEYSSKNVKFNDSQK
jgi:hypothetical protein